MKFEMFLRSLLYLAGAALVGMSFVGCSSDGSATSQPLAAQTAPVTPTYDPAALSCDPFGGGATYVNLGLSAKLFYLTASMPQYTDVEDYITKGIELPVDVFFAQVNVPTRLFTAGFPSQAGPAFTTPDGQVLLEYFALRYESVLQLGPHDAAGKYQIGILSDDGAILSVDQGGGLSQFLNNDGTHPSRFGCATQTIRFDNSTQLPIQLDYYQGPRYHIANILVWRQISDDVDETKDPTVLSDPACGLTGNETFFDYTQTPSAPTQTWLDLLGRGWRVIAPENFALPGQTPVNPCCPGCTIGA
jgi:hypothetical protein